MMKEELMTLNSEMKKMKEENSTLRELLKKQEKFIHDQWEFNRKKKVA